VTRAGESIVLAPNSKEKTMAITFYYAPMSSASRVTWALEELGIPHERVRIHLDKGDQKKPEFLAINPNGKVPALVDGDAKLFESLAILLHLGERYGVEKNMWPKPGTTDRADAITYTVWGTIQIIDCVIDYFLHSGAVHFSLPPELRSEHALKGSLEMWHKHVGILDKRLEGRQYIVGNGFTLCDVANASIFGLAQMGKMPLESYKNVQTWVARCSSRPAFAKTMSEK
jgi:glutathione S-transferase